MSESPKGDAFVHAEVAAFASKLFNDTGVRLDRVSISWTVYSTSNITQRHHCANIDRIEVESTTYPKGAA
jgi:hypothetical protein